MQRIIKRPVPARRNRERRLAPDLTACLLLTSLVAKPQEHNSRARSGVSPLPDSAMFVQATFHRERENANPTGKEVCKRQGLPSLALQACISALWVCVSSATLRTERAKRNRELVAPCFSPQPNVRLVWLPLDWARTFSFPRSNSRTDAGQKMLCRTRPGRNESSCERDRLHLRSRSAQGKNAALISCDDGSSRACGASYVLPSADLFPISSFPSSTP